MGNFIFNTYLFDCAKICGVQDLQKFIFMKLIEFFLLASQHVVAQNKLCVVSVFI